MPTVIGFTGYAQSGKDTAAGFLVEKGFKRLAFADALRQSLFNLNPIVAVHREAVKPGWGRVQTILADIGYEEAKRQYPEYRELLQRLGTEVGRELYGENFWVERVTRQIHNGDRVVITDVRFPNEEAAVRNLGGRIYRINRPGTEAVNTHVSDTGIERLFVDGVIPNNGSLDDFRSAVLSATGVN